MLINLINAIAIIIGGSLGKVLGKSFSKDLSKLLIKQWD